MQFSGEWEHVISWEYCMGTLRYCDTDPGHWVTAWDEARFGGKTSALAIKARNKYGPSSTSSGRIWEIDQKLHRFGLGTLFECMTGRVKTRSWAFPAPHITALYAWITMGFLLIGIGYGLAAARGYVLALRWPTEAHGLLLLAAVLVLIFQISMWNRLAVSVDCLLRGSATVSAYSWRFLPLRVRFLNQIGVEPAYVLLD
jgi:hypothetical protein